MEPEEQEEREPEEAELLIVPALKFGAFTGCSGLVVGAIVGLFRMPTPGPFALASGFQWFALGSTFWATRGAILRYRYLDDSTPKDRRHVSTFAGALTGGTIGGLIRGPRNILPGAIMFALFGLAGQSIYNRADGAHTQSVLAAAAASSAPTAQKQITPPSSWAKKYSPVRVLSDEEYESMLRERLLAVEVEITLLDEKIEGLRAQEGETEGSKEEKGDDMEMGSGRK